MSEQNEQVTLMQWLKIKHKSAELVTTASANGGSRNVKEAANLKRSGVKAGYPDLFVAVPSAGFHGLFIEYKTKTGTLQANQREWLCRLNDNGYLAVCCKGLDEAMTLINAYLKEQD